MRLPGVPDDATLPSSGALITKVRFVRVNVFDPTIVEEDMVARRRGAAVPCPTGRANSVLA